MSAIRPRPVPSPQPVPKVEAWEIPGIQCYEPPDGVFYAQMGPTGGKQGYSAITGRWPSSVVLCRCVNVGLSECYMIY